MTFLNLPFILATMMVLRGVDAACVEDNCYRGEILHHKAYTKVGIKMY